jgi:hypothetical protein
MGGYGGKRSSVVQGGSHHGEETWARWSGSNGMISRTLVVGHKLIIPCEGQSRLALSLDFE